MGGVARITDVAVQNIAQNAPNMQVWNLWKCGNITDAGMSRDIKVYFLPPSILGVIAIGKNCHSLQHIQLSDCSRITDKSLHSLAEGCPELITAILGGYASTSKLVRSVNTLFY